MGRKKNNHCMIIFLIILTGIIYLILNVNLILAQGIITTTNINSTYTTNDASNVEVGLEQVLQFNGTNFTEYANQNVTLMVYLENGSAWWDKTNLQWDFPVIVSVDADGNFSYNWYLPYTELVWPNATANVTIGAGQYVMPGLQNVYIANQSVLGGLVWVKRENYTLTQQAIWGDSQKIYVGGTGNVTAYNKNGAQSTYYSNSNASWVWRTILNTTGVVQEVWTEPDGTYVYIVQTTAGWLRRLNATNGTVMNSVDGATSTEKYSVWGDTNYIYTGTESGVIRNYTKSLSAYSTFTNTPADASVVYDLWSDNTTLYACFANGFIYAYNLTTLQTLWTNQSAFNLATGAPYACYGIFGDEEAVYSSYQQGLLAKWNKTNGQLIWTAQDYTYSATPAGVTNINNIWVNSDYVYALYSDGRVLYFNKTTGASNLFRLYPYHITGLTTTTGNAIYGDENYIYTAHALGWIFKYGRKNDNLEPHPEANFWIRDLGDTWNFILKPRKSIFSNNESLTFDFWAFDNKTNPVDVSSARLQGTYFNTRTSSNYNTWQAATFTKLALDPRISTASLGAAQYNFYNNITYASCPATHYAISGFYANKTGWFLSTGGGWCLYNIADVPPPVYSTLNATKPLSTYILANIVPRAMINSTNAAWYNILNGNYSNNPYTNLTKFYGADKYTWFAVFGSNPTTLGAAAPVQPLNSGIVGLVKKAGSDYQYTWADKFGRSDTWNPATKIMYSRFSLAQNSTPFEMYWVFADTTGSGSTPYIASAIEKTTMAIGSPVNITVQEDEYNDTTGWEIDGSFFFHRRNITYIEPNIVERVDEPISFIIDPLGNLSSDCRDIRIVDDASNLVVFQNETCSSNSVNLWIFINLTQGENKNFTVYYNSTASSPSFTSMNTTTATACPNQNIGLNWMNLAYDTNYSKSYNWTGWGLDATELLRFNFGNTTSWVVATSVQDLYWSYNNGTGTTAVDGWNQRCMTQTGPIFTKMSMNQTSMALADAKNLSIFGTVYVFQKSGRVKVIMQPSTNISDFRDGYPAYLRYGMDTISPQGKSTAADFYHVWTDWGGRREGLDKTVLGEPLLEYTNYTVNGVSTPLKVTFRFPFTDAFTFNYNASTPTCMGNQLVSFFNYTNNENPLGGGGTLATLAAAANWDFGTCHESIVNNMTKYNEGWSMIYPDLRIYGTTWNRWVDSATTGPYTYARFYLFQNNYTPFSRENRFYTYMTTLYYGARETLVPVNMCPDVEHGYNSYDEMLNNISKTTIDQERKTSGTYDCIMNLAKLVDGKGADKAEFILMKNATVYAGEAKRIDELYPTTKTDTGYTQTTANKIKYWYGGWFATITEEPYVLHGYSTSGAPQFQDYIYYYQAPQQYFNKNVWDETYFWNQSETQLTGGTGVGIGSELYNFTNSTSLNGFACNLIAGAAAQYDSVTRKGWTHLGTSALTCPYSTENMAHYAYAKPSYSSYISLYSTTASTAGGYVDFYIFGKNNYSAQVGTHNSLYDYLHYPDGIDTEPQDVNDLNESERHNNKQPWYCQESSKINRVFCIAHASIGSFISSTAAGTANEQVLWGEDYSSTTELNRFNYYVNTRWTGGVQYSNDYLVRKYVYQFLSPGEFDLNLLYAGNGTSVSKIGMVYPDASKAMTQGYLQGFDAGDRFWIYFDINDRQYSTGQEININGTLFKNDTRLVGVPVSLMILKTDNTFVTSAVKTTDSSGKFTWAYTLPSTLTSGLYYIKADYNNGEIVNKFGLKVTTNVVTITTDKAAYSSGETVTTTLTIKDYLTDEYVDPDQIELRYYSPDSSIIRCAKYPSTASVSNCIYNLTKTATGTYSDSFALSESAQLGNYLQMVTTTNTGVTANFYDTFAVSEFTGWIDVSINNTIIGTSFTSNVTTTNTGTTPVTKTVEVTVPTSCGLITSITNATGNTIAYNIQDLSSACKVYWDVTLEGAASTTFLIQATLASSSGANPEIEIDTPSVINTNTNFGINAFIRNTNGQLTNCVDALLTLKDNLNDTILLNGVAMTNSATGQYNYTTSLPYQSTFLAQVNCSIGSTVYVSNPKIISSYSSGSSASIDYDQLASFVWNYTSRNLTYYNESVSESLKSCLKDATCSAWWINTTLSDINNGINNLQTNITYIKNNVFYQGNATDTFLMDYFATFYAEPGSRAELFVLTRDLLGNSKTVSEANCNITQKGIIISNTTISLNPGIVYAYWNVSASQLAGEYYWNCTLTESATNLQVPFFIANTTETGTVSSYPKIKLSASTPIAVSTFANIGALVKSSTGVPIDCDGNLDISMIDLNDGSLTSGVMVKLGTGMYNYSWETPATVSVFYINASCLISGIRYTDSTTLSTKKVQTDVTINSTEISDTVWNNTNRSLSNFNFTVNTTVNNTAIAESVWSWNGLINGNLLSQIASTIWNWAGSFSSTIGDFFSNRIWTRTDRNLTYYEDTTNYSQIAFDVWNYTDKNLTYFPTQNNITSEDIWQYTSRNLTYFPTQNNLTAYDVWNYISRNLTGSSSITGDYRMLLSDFPGIVAGDKYMARLNVFNSTGSPTNLSELPNITIYNSLRDIIVSAAQFNYSSEGLYTYNYTTLAAAISGVWESVVTANYSGEIVYLNDYWEISGSPADVTINNITDKIIPNILADIEIINMGTQASDFEYIYCIVDSEENKCGGSNDIAYQYGTRYILAGDTWNPILELEVPSTGDYWFKIKAKALGEVKWAGAAKLFTAVEGMGGYNNILINLTKQTDGNRTIVNKCGINSLGGIIVCGYSIGDLIWPSSPQAGFSVFILVLFGIFLFVIGLVKDKKEKERQKKKMLLAGKKDKDER